MAKYRVLVEVTDKSEEFIINAGTEDQAKNKAIRQFCMTTKNVRGAQLSVRVLDPMPVLAD
jgi:hypothetical protein